MPAYVDPLFGIHLTGGSHSIKNSFTQYRELGARARAMLLGAAAARWKVDVATLRTQAGTVLGPGGRKLGYGELAEAAMALPVPEKVALKDPKDFRIIGRPTTRLDAQAKSSGRQDFGIDVRLPGQLTAVVARPPVFGATLAVGGRQRGRAVKGVKAVLRVPLDRGAEGVAVVADGYWPAKQGRDALKLRVGHSRPSRRSTASGSSPSTASWPAARPAQVRRRHGAARPRRPSKLEAEFVFPYLAHAPMEPLNCTVAAVRATAPSCGSARRCPGLDGGRGARVLGVKPRAGEGATCRWRAAASAGASRATSDYVVEACEIAKAARAAGLNAPVRTLWSREDDMRGGYYRPMHLHRARIGFDEQRQGAGLGPRHRRPVHHHGHGVRAVPGQGRHRRHGDGGHARALPAADAPDRASPQAQRAGAVVAQRGLHPHRLRDGDLLDEIARATKQDPVAYRMRLFGDKHPRHRAALQLAVDKSGYGKKQLPAGRAWGVAVHESFDSRRGLRGRSLGEGRPAGAAPRDRRRALQSGRQPAQRGSAGAGRGGDGPVDVPAGCGHHAQGRRRRAEQLRRLHRGRASPTCPQFDVHIVPSAEPPTGMGEPGLPPLAPAFANAIARLTGKPLRQLPFNVG